MFSYNNLLNSTDLVLNSLSIVNSQGQPEDINDLISNGGGNVDAYSKTETDTLLSAKQNTVTNDSLQISHINTLQSVLNGKQPTITNNSLQIAFTNGLQSALNNKQNITTPLTTLLSLYNTDGIYSIPQTTSAITNITGVLSNLETNNKTNLVSALNEVALLINGFSISNKSLNITSENFILNYTGSGVLPSIASNELTFESESNFSLSQDITNSTIDETSEWTLILKIHFTNYPNTTPLNINFGLDYTDTVFSVLGSGGSPTTNELILRGDPNNIITNGLTITNNTGLPAGYYNELEKYYQFKYLSNNNTEINIYDNLYNLLWTTTITSAVAYSSNNSLINIHLGNNPPITGVLKGVEIQQNNTFTVQEFEKNLKLKNIKMLMLLI